ncbi:sensor histidine kinase [Actinoplanes solisilvae]|uniref:sensor histidine kinase n=1 Tax=Actinoplanes solisilvae TaxID=2486853 RepID=UPI000FD9BF5F|nr:histidine kinase [Actinoplanes solisilvae]
MSRFAPRTLLTDASLALVLLGLTIGPALVSRSLGVQKPTMPTDVPWWLLAGLVVAGLLIRQPYPFVALALTGVGTLGHLAGHTKFQLLDLALPLTLYTVATVARRRRVALAVLGVVMALTYAAMLSGRILEQQAAERSDKAVRLEAEFGPAGQPVKKATAARVGGVLTDITIDTSQAVLEMWLLLVAAFAVGDGVRSRRAHLAAVEQRTADLARQERQRAALAVAAERARITRDLHDVVAHGMSVMVVQAQGAAAALNRHPERAATALEHVIDTGRSSLAEMRRLLAAGRTEPADDVRLAPLPGVGAVPSLVDQLRSAGMRISLSIEGVPDVVPAAVDLSAYRIVQEALTNTLKHAGRDAGARVRLEFDPRCLRVEVADDGAGPAEQSETHGNGLRGIAERVAMLGGVLESGRGDGSGFRLSVTLPLPAPATLAVDR